LVFFVTSVVFQLYHNFLAHMNQLVNWICILLPSVKLSHFNLLWKHYTKWN
jgi:hypothetical protein